MEEHKEVTNTRTEETVGLYCKKCTSKTTKDDLLHFYLGSEEKVSCNHCLSDRGTMEIINFGEDDKCQTCLIKKSDTFYYHCFTSCGHWVCQDCYREKGCCSTCRCPICELESWEPLRLEKIYTPLKIDIIPEKFLECFAQLYQHVENILPKHVCGITLPIIEYYKWLVLLNEFGQDNKLYPGRWIDEIWKIHIMDTELYDKFSTLFGRKLHYYPENSYLTPINRHFRHSYTLDCYVKKFGVMDESLYPLWKFHDEILLREDSFAPEKLHIQNPNSRIYIFSYPSNTKLIDLAKLLLDRFQFTYKPEVSFVYNGRRLESTKTLEEHGVKSGSLLQVLYY